MDVPLRRLVATVLGVVLVACLAAAALDMLPRLRNGVPIEGLHWVQAAGSMFWALPVTLFALSGAAGLALLATYLSLGRIPTAAFAGSGAVIGAGAFVAVGTPWYEAVDGVGPTSIALGAAAFAVCAVAYAVATGAAARSVSGISSTSGSSLTVSDP